MTKERLITKKKAAINPNYHYFRTLFKGILKDEGLKNFSVKQLELLAEILDTMEVKNRQNNPFYTLSATEVLHQKTGTIIELMPDNSVRTEEEDEVMLRASRSTYTHYKKLVEEDKR